jgi:hypothetical protein
MQKGEFSMSLLFLIIAPFEYSLAGTLLLWILIFIYPPVFFVLWCISYLLIEWIDYKFGDSNG